MALLELKNLHVALEDGTEIVKGVDLAVNTNETHAVMGPNGSGKSTLAYAMLKPTIAVLDETDSGLDIDALKIVAGGVKELVGPNMGAIVITHYQRILNYIEPDYVHVFVDGRIVEEGGPELAHKLEAEGYEAFMPAGAARGGES